jgi:hypothetical protein
MQRVSDVHVDHLLALAVFSTLELLDQRLALGQGELARDQLAGSFDDPAVEGDDDRADDAPLPAGQRGARLALESDLVPRGVLDQHVDEVGGGATESAAVGQPAGGAFSTAHDPASGAARADLGDVEAGREVDPLDQRPAIIVPAADVSARLCRPRPHCEPLSHPRSSGIIRARSITQEIFAALAPSRVQGIDAGIFGLILGVLRVILSGTEPRGLGISGIGGGQPGELPSGRRLTRMKGVSGEREVDECPRGWRRSAHGAVDPSKIVARSSAR